MTKTMIMYAWNSNHGEVTSFTFGDVGWFGAYFFAITHGPYPETMMDGKGEPF